MPEKLVFSQTTFSETPIEALNETKGVCIQRFGCTQGLSREEYKDCDELCVKRYVGVTSSLLDDIDFSSIANMPEEYLTAARDESMALTNQAIGQANAIMDMAAKHLTALRFYDALLKYRQISPLEHSNNTWQITEENGFMPSETGVMSNAVYRFWYKYTEETGCGFKNQEPVWYLSWDVNVRSAAPEMKNVKIAGQTRKRFTDKSVMLNYLEGRKRKYSGLFQEVFPAVPKEYKRLFSYAGIMLPGYRVIGLPDIDGDASNCSKCYTAEN